MNKAPTAYARPDRRYFHPYTPAFIWMASDPCVRISRSNRQDNDKSDVGDGKMTTIKDGSH
jgi:hypothetical protein